MGAWLVCELEIENGQFISSLMAISTFQNTLVSMLLILLIQYMISWKLWPPS